MIPNYQLQSVNRKLQKLLKLKILFQSFVKCHFGIFHFGSQYFNINCFHIINTRWIEPRIFDEREVSHAKRAANKIAKGSDFVHRGTTRVFLLLPKHAASARILFLSFVGKDSFGSLHSNPTRFASLADLVGSRVHFVIEPLEKKKTKQRDWLALAFFQLKYFRFFSILELRKRNLIRFALIINDYD